MLIPLSSFCGSAWPHCLQPTYVTYPIPLPHYFIVHLDTIPSPWGWWQHIPLKHFINSRSHVVSRHRTPSADQHAAYNEGLQIYGKAMRRMRDDREDAKCEWLLSISIVTHSNSWKKNSANKHSNYFQYKLHLSYTLTDQHNYSKYVVMVD